MIQFSHNYIFIYALTLDQICGYVGVLYSEINNDSFAYMQLFVFLEVSNV